MIRPKWKPHPLYTIWAGMRARCNNPKNKHFKDYGGRGIKMCDRWEISLANFAEDMGPRPSLDHSVERNNNDLGYSKENCRWATDVEQGRNKRNNKMLTHGGATRCQAEWCEVTGLPKSCILWRLKSGWPVDKALTLPKGTPLEEGRRHRADQQTGEQEKNNGN